MKGCVALLILAGACGSGSATHVTISGGTTAFTGTEAMSAFWSLTAFSSEGPNYPVTLVSVSVVSASGLCEDVKARIIRASSTFVNIEVSHGTADPIPAGTYSVGFPSAGDAAPTAGVMVTSADASCQTKAGPGTFASSGTVTLSRIDATAVSGSVDVTLSDGGRITGVFFAPRCAAVETFDPAAEWKCAPR